MTSALKASLSKVHILMQERMTCSASTGGYPLGVLLEYIVHVYP